MTGWRSILCENITSWEALADFLELDGRARGRIHKQPHLAFNLPLRLAKKIAKNTLDDPILKQFVPLDSETKKVHGFVSDPVEDEGSRKAPKLLHKYPGRVLLVCTSVCAMHCRYCFRQQFDYLCGDKTFAEELNYIQNDPSIREVILSGGDPLSLSDLVLDQLLQQLAQISHVKSIRFHTRFPIGIPERIDASFLQLIERVPQQVWFVLHVNHPKELDDDIFQAIRELQKKRVVVLNQAVLLRGVNDSVNVQKELANRLLENGMISYYLHQLDRVEGAAHFEVPEEEGHAMIAALQEQLPGYAVPKYVKEIPGEKSKMLLS